MNIRKTCVLGLAVAASSVALANGKTWYVSADLGNDDNDGKTMATAYKTLEAVFGESMTPAKNGKGWHDTVVLSNGTYYVSKPITTSCSNLKGWTGDPKDVILDGQGTSAILYHGYIYPRYATTTSGITFRNGAYQKYGAFYIAPVASVDGGGDVFTNCVFRDMQYIKPASTANKFVLGGALFLQRESYAKDCYFENCRAASDYSSDDRVYGGAIGTYQAGPVISGCVISNCSSYAVKGGEMYGGAIASYWENPGCVVTNCTIYDCSAKFGGAIYMRKNAKIYDTKIYNCSAYRGGGIEMVTNAVIAGCVVSNCFATSHGGGIYDDEATVRIRDTKVLDCYIKFSDGNSHFGGGIYVPETDVQVTNTVVTYGKATHGGGICAAGNAKILKCTLVGNEAAWGGGGLYLNGTGSGAKIFDCTVISNKTTVSTSVTYGGGGIYARPRAEIRDCVISGNSSLSYGGAIRSERYVTISNVVAVGNRATYGGGFCLMATNVVYDCVISNNVAQSGGGGLWGCDTADSGSNRYKAYDVLVANSVVCSNRVTNTDDNWTYKGGGILDHQGALTVTNCLFANNYASAGAGLSVGNAKVVACTVSSNECYYGGGGLYMVSGANGLTVENCLFETNRVTGYKSGNNFSGGAIYISSCNRIRIADSALVNNTAVMTGGGLHVHNGTGLLVTNCVISGSRVDPTAGSNCGQGSAIDMQGRSNDEFVDVIVEKSYGWRGTLKMEHYGSAYYGTGFKMRNCLFQKNHLTEQGHIYTQYVNVTNYYDRCSFLGNTGGAVFRWHGYIDGAQSNQYINACVFAGNAQDFGKSPAYPVNIQNTYGWNITKSTYPYASTFVDAAHGDYRPCKGSILVDYACTPWAPFDDTSWAEGGKKRTDLGDGKWSLEKVGDYGVRIVHNDAKPRLSGASVDLGCFEYPQKRGLLIVVH